MSFMIIFVRSLHGNNWNKNTKCYQPIPALVCRRQRSLKAHEVDDIPAELRDPRNKTQSIWSAWCKHVNIPIISIFATVQ